MNRGNTGHVPHETIYKYIGMVQAGVASLHHVEGKGIGHAPTPHPHLYTHTYTHEVAHGIYTTCGHDT